MIYFDFKPNGNVGSYQQNCSFLHITPIYILLSEGFYSFPLSGKSGSDFDEVI